MQDWIAWCLALIRTSVQWLGTVQLLGVSVLWIVIAAFFLSILVRGLIIRV